MLSKYNYECRVKKPHGCAWSFRKNSFTFRPNEHFGERSTEHLTEHYVQYISITYGCATEHIGEHPSEHPTERYLTNFTTSSRTYLLRPAIPNPRDLSISIKYHL